MYVIISYDIPDDKRRLRVAKTLKRFSDRVQYSVFEGEMEKSELEKLKKIMMKKVDINEDSVRIYTLCAVCKTHLDIIGLGEVQKDPDIIIV